MKNKVKFFVLGFIFCLMLGGLVYGMTQVTDVYFSNFGIKLNGQSYNPEMPVLNYQGRTYLALRELGTVTGNEVDFIDNTIIINNSNYTAPKSEYGLNDTFTYKNGNSIYEVTITRIRETSERNKYSDKNPAQVFIIDYTYKNISGESLYISDMDFKVIDEQGEVGDTYPIITEKNPQSIPVGATCKAQAVYGINNKSNNLTIYFYDNMFMEHDAIFNIKVK